MSNSNAKEFLVDVISQLEHEYAEEEDSLTHPTATIRPEELERKRTAWQKKIALYSIVSDLTNEQASLSHEQRIQARACIERIWSLIKVSQPEIDRDRLMFANAFQIATYLNSCKA